MWRVMALSAVVVGLVACTVDRNEDATTQAREEIREGVERRAAEHRAEEERLDQAAGYRIVETSGSQIKRASRVSARIEVEPGLSREKLTLTLEAAAHRIYDSHDVMAANVFAYKRGTRTDGAYTAGRATKAPGGDWARAQEYGTRTVSVDLAEAYFYEAEEGYAVGQAAVLYGRRDVFVSVSPDHWADEAYLIAYMPTDTPVEVRDRRDIQVGSNHVMTRYRVLFDKDGEPLTGWVHDSQLADR